MYKMYEIARVGARISQVVTRNIWKQNAGVRTLLSSAFSCSDIWEKRLEDPIIRNMKLEEFIFELDKRYARDKKVSAVDVDLLTHKISEESHLEILEEMVYRLRRCPNTCHTLPSTGHAFIRQLLQYGKFHDIIRVLDDRVNYGVFIEPYCSSLLMDTFIEQKNYTNAAKVASFMMLQEDFGDSLSRALALYSCHMYAKDPNAIPWKEEVKNEEESQAGDEDDEDELDEVRKRVDMIREPFFDDHFDLQEPKYIIGKTMAYVGKLYDDAVGRSYQLIGLAMYRKWDKLKDLIAKWMKSSEKELVSESAIQIANNEIASIIDDKRRAEVQSEFAGILENLGKRASKVTLDDMINKLIKTEISENESTVIKKQMELYKAWSKLREEVLQLQIRAKLREQTVKTIREKKTSLAEREELLYFFENFEKHALKLPNQPVLGPEEPIPKYKPPPDWHKVNVEEDYEDGLFMPPDTLREKFTEPSDPPKPKK